MYLQNIRKHQNSAFSTSRLAKLTRNYILWEEKIHAGPEEFMKTRTRNILQVLRGTIQNFVKIARVYHRQFSLLPRDTRGEGVEGNVLSASTSEKRLSQLAD